MMPITVAYLRQQAALKDSRARVVIVTDDEELQALDLRIVGCYPDTTDEKGKWESTFKIKIGRRKWHE